MRPSDLELVELEAEDSIPFNHPDVWPQVEALIYEIRRLRSLISRAHPHLDAVQAPQDLLDELGAEVREIAADRLARAHATASGDAGETK